GASTPAPPPPAEQPTNGTTPEDGYVTARCPDCGFSGRVPDKFLGRPVKCRQCGTMFPVGGPPKPAEPEPAAPTRSEQAADTPPPPPPEEPSAAPAAAATLPDEIGLEGEEETPQVAAQDEQLDVIDEVDVIEDAECPLCGHRVKLPPNFEGGRLKC